MATSEQVQELLNEPAGAHPVGVTPNFANPTNNLLIITLVFCVLFSTLAVQMRFYTKLFLIRSVEYEDYAVLISWICLVGQLVPSGMTSRYGSGIHIWNVRMKDFFQMLRWVNISAITYCPVVFFIKLSILLQYLRIFRPTRQGNMFLYVGVQICIWATFLFYLIAMIFYIIMCIPREKIWNPLGTTGHCFNSNAIYLSSGVFNVVSDFTILFLPMPSVWKLKVSMKRKIGILAVFSTGFFACITSIMRTYYTWKLIESEDYTYFIFKMGLWTLAETSAGVVVSCLPVLPRFFQFVGPKICKSFSSSVSKAKVGSMSDSTRFEDPKFFTKFKHLFTNHSISETLNDSSPTRSQPGDESINQGRQNPKSTKQVSIEGESTSGLVLALDDRQATTHDDLESGQQGIRVDRTAHN